MIDIDHIVILLLLVIAGISNGGMDVLTYNPGKFPLIRIGGTNVANTHGINANGTQSTYLQWFRTGGIF